MQLRERGMEAVLVFHQFPAGAALAGGGVVALRQFFGERMRVREAGSVFDFRPGGSWAVNGEVLADVATM